MKLYAVGINDMIDNEDYAPHCHKQYTIVVEAGSVAVAKHEAIDACRREYRNSLVGDYLEIAWVREKDTEKYNERGSKLYVQK